MPLFLPGPGPLVHQGGSNVFLTVPSLDLDASSGIATASGETAALAFTWTADTGAATAGGGTANVSEGLTAVTGAATASGGTATLSFTYTAAAGTATAGGGDATASIEFAPAAIVTGPGRVGPVRAVTTPPSLYRLVRASSIIGGLALPTDVTLTADTGTSTAAGGTTDLSFTVSAATGAATASGGTASLAETLLAASGTATAGGGTASLTVTLLAATGTATAAGGDATFSSAAAATGTIIGRGLTAGVARVVSPPAPLYKLTRTSSTVGGLAPSVDLNLTADTGAATATGGDATVSVTTPGAIPGAVVSGGTRNVFRALRRAQAQWVPPRPASRPFSLTEAPPTPSATAGGGTALLTLTYLAATGTATAGGGDATASVSGGSSFTATNGTAAATGGTATLRFIYATTSATATAGGGTATASKSYNLTAQTGNSTAGGGTLTVTYTWIAATGTAVAQGGTATAISFIPTLGHVDGATFTTSSIEQASNITNIEAGAALAGIID